MLKVNDLQFTVLMGVAVKYMTKLSLLLIGSACILLAFFVIYQSMAMYNNRVDEILARPANEIINSANGINHLYESYFQRIMVMNRYPQLQRYLRLQSYTPFSVDVFDFYRNLNIVNIALRYPEGAWEFTIYSMNNNITKGSIIRDISDLDQSLFEELNAAPHNYLYRKYLPERRLIGFYMVTSFLEPYGNELIDSLIIKEALVSVDTIKTRIGDEITGDFPLAYLFDEAGAVITGFSNNGNNGNLNDFSDIDEFMLWLDEQNRNYYILQGEILYGDTIFVFVPRQYVREHMANFFVFWVAGAVLLILVGGLSIMIATIRLKTHFKQAADMETEKNELEVELLQSLINPHLLYNSLGGIKHAENDPNRTKIIDDLIAFYRIALNHGNKMLTISGEVEMIRLYLDIQKFAYDAEFSYSIEIEDEVKEKQILKNLIQPIVENAFLHGISKHKSTDCIRIIIKRDDAFMLIIVSDNGEGMDDRKVGYINNNDPNFIGYGLNNIKRRIEVNYGVEYGFTIESEIGIGTTLTMRLPY